MTRSKSPLDLALDVQKFLEEKGKVAHQWQTLDGKPTFCSTCGLTKEQLMKSPSSMEYLPCKGFISDGLS